MKAIVFTKYGPPDVLQLEEVEKPTPKDNEVLIRVHAATVNAGDCEIRSLKAPFVSRLFVRIYVGIIKPRVKILGQEMAGEIESVGKDVQLFKKGDQVFAFCIFGAYAEYICMPEDAALALKPTNMTSDEAAAVPLGGLNALYFLKKANIQSGQKVLINGAGGSIGTSAIQLAKSFGAEVTGVDSAEKLDMLRSIGADHVIDYTQEDFTQNGQTYDVIFDIVGKGSFSRSIRSLKKEGFLLLANLELSRMIRGLWISKTSAKKVVFGLAGDSAEDLISLKDLIEAGKIKTVIDRRYPLEQIAEAHSYVEKGHKKGYVVITV